MVEAGRRGGPGQGEMVRGTTGNLCVAYDSGKGAEGEECVLVRDDVGAWREENMRRCGVRQ